MDTAQHKISKTFCSIVKLLFIFKVNIYFFIISFRSTGEVENFNNLILMYSGKRFAYSPPVYRARSQLAALDYNAHMDRETKRKPDGTIQ